MREDEYIIPPLRDTLSFPNPRFAPSEGLLAYGGDLNPQRLLSAYRKGIFPWYNEGDPILWWSPDPRFVLFPKDIKISKSFRRVLRNTSYSVFFDTAFGEVIEQCSKVPREGQNGTWLIEDMKRAYKELHNMGYAHSVEVYIDGKLAGGLYGVALGSAFFGESMFTLKPNGSKIALKALSDVLSENGYDFVDCQVVTEHLRRMGAIEIDRDEFLDRLDVAMQKPGLYGNWSQLKWEYSDDR